MRIVQEALTNVRKHAGRAASAAVRLSYDTDVLVVEVADDGRGAASHGGRMIDEASRKLAAKLVARGRAAGLGE